MGTIPPSAVLFKRCFFLSRNVLLSLPFVLRLQQKWEPHPIASIHQPHVVFVHIIVCGLIVWNWINWYFARKKKKEKNAGENCAKVDRWIITFCCCTSSSGTFKYFGCNGLILRTGCQTRPLLSVLIKWQMTCSTFGAVLALSNWFLNHCGNFSTFFCKQSLISHKVGSVDTPPYLSPSTSCTGSRWSTGWNTTTSTRGCRQNNCGEQKCPNHFNIPLLGGNTWGGIYYQDFKYVYTTVHYCNRLYSTQKQIFGAL